MPHYKLTYFDITGLGEVHRYLFAYGHIKYEDNRIQMDEWAFYKPLTPFGQLPLLEIDGKVYHQSLAIGRYLAKIVGIGPKTDMEDFLINIAVDTVHEFRVETFKPTYEFNPKLREKNIAKMFEEHLPNYLPKLDKMAKENNGYFVLGRLTLADIYFVAFKPYFDKTFKRNIFEGYDHLNRLIENVESIPSIKKWIETRPPRITFDFDKIIQLLGEAEADKEKVNEDEN